MGPEPRVIHLHQIGHQRFSHFHELMTIDNEKCRRWEIPPGDINVFICLMPDGYNISNKHMNMTHGPYQNPLERCWQQSSCVLPEDRQLSCWFVWKHLPIYYLFTYHFVNTEGFLTISQQGVGFLQIWLSWLLLWDNLQMLRVEQEWIQGLHICN